MEEERWKREIHMGHSFYDLPAGVALIQTSVVRYHKYEYMDLTSPF